MSYFVQPLLLNIPTARGDDLSFMNLLIHPLQTQRSSYQNKLATFSGQLIIVMVKYIAGHLQVIFSFLILFRQKSI